MKNLESVVKAHPFPDYTDWWEMGDKFIRFMSGAILSQWKELGGKKKDINQVRKYLTEYVQLVYGQEADPKLVDDFMRGDSSRTFYSGEFDALSYAFYRSAFERLGEKFVEDDSVIMREIGQFSIRVGKEYFNSILDHLQLEIPSDLNTPEQFTLLQKNIEQIGKFFLDQGYLRDDFYFSFSVDVTYEGKKIKQDTGDFLQNLQHNGVGYAVYIMGYPAILPSAVYLFQMYGEAQHHSSRTIEELFERAGYQARETDDFDPTNYPSDKVVELWEIRPL
jgi:hypothetical protein